MIENERLKEDSVHNKICKGNTLQIRIILMNMPCYHDKKIICA
jgi:hypothetical protein